MNLDLVFVAYNSEKWIKNCFRSIGKSNYDLKKINIYVVDNQSTDQTIEALQRAKADLGEQIGTFEIIQANENLGFGKGNNLGFSKGHSNIVCFLNIDTEVFPDTFKELAEEVQNSKDEVGLWEFRQFPYEHPKFYDILTGYTSWSSGAAFAIRRPIYEELGGFDNKIFMYAEDVDLSWRIRAKGYKLKYCPKVTIMHYAYASAGEVKPTQYLNSVINNLLLRYRYLSFKDALKGNIQVLALMRHKGPFEHSRKMLLKKYIGHFSQIPHFRKWKKENPNWDVSFSPKFLGWDYEIIREGAFYENEYPKTMPLVSIIVRTCNRPQVLREALISLRQQTYKNIEIVVVEDGVNTAEALIQEEFGDLNIKYAATGKNVGRSAAGNKAMTIATGKYLNFLDDDDLFFADHVEVLVKNLEKSDKKLAYTLAYETPIIIHSKNPYEYQEVYHNLIYKQPFNRLTLFHHNYIPIQAIMFEKSLFEQYGGLDETLDALEDWDLWVRYALKNDFLYIPKVTSIYRVPFNREVNEERQKALDEALEVVRAKHQSYRTEVSPFEIARDLESELSTYSIKISAETMARLQQKVPMADKGIILLRKLMRK